MHNNILLLGSTGAFGTAFENILKEKGINCISLNHQDLEITNQENLEKIIIKHNPDTIVNSVAIVGIDLCESMPQKTFEINSTVVLNLAKICKQKNITLIQMSTSSVFDGKKDGFYTEEDIPNPINIYGASKYNAECFVKNICDKYYILRLPKLFGIRRNKNNGIIDNLLTWIKEDKELKMSTDVIDTFGYTTDLAKSLLGVIKKSPYGIYHLTNSGCASYYEFASELIRTMSINKKVVPVKHSSFKSTNYKSLNSRIISIKLDPIRDWKDALYDYVHFDLNKK